MHCLVIYRSCISFVDQIDGLLTPCSPLIYVKAGNPLQHSCLETLMDRRYSGLQSMQLQSQHDWATEHVCTVLSYQTSIQVIHKYCFERNSYLPYFRIYFKILKLQKDYYLSKDSVIRTSCWMVLKIFIIITVFYQENSCR